MTFWLSDHPIEGSREKERLAHPGAGAFVSFEGWVRNEHHGRAVIALDYDAYRPLAIKEGSRILIEAQTRFHLSGIFGIHRLGYLNIGECAVWIGASAAHRREAFAACMWVMDRIKETVPIWKKEYFADGSSHWVQGAG